MPVLDGAGVTLTVLPGTVEGPGANGGVGAGLMPGGGAKGDGEGDGEVKGEGAVVPSMDGMTISAPTFNFVGSGNLSLLASHIFFQCFSLLKSFWEINAKESPFWMV